MVELTEIRTIDTLMQWIEENVPEDNRGTNGSIRDEAEWFLACMQAASMSENSLKDNAHICLYGMPTINGNDLEAANILDVIWQDVDFDAENGDDNECSLEYALEELTTSISRHWDIEI